MEEKKFFDEKAAAENAVTESSGDKAPAAWSPGKWRRAFAGLLVLAGLLSLLLYSLKSTPPPPPAPIEQQEPGSSSAPSAAVPEESEETVVYPVGEILLTDQRTEYQDGELLLSVPRLGLDDLPVLSGDSFTVLAEGVGLYDYSCLPGEASNANVSIIAHRDVAGQEFYYIDTLVPGDLIYLKHKNVLYTYEYEKTVIIKPNNLDIVPCGEKAMVTLVSCHPIGTTFRRIVVTGVLISAETME